MNNQIRCLCRKILHTSTFWFFLLFTSKGIQREFLRESAQSPSIIKRRKINCSLRRTLYNFNIIFLDFYNNSKKSFMECFTGNSFQGTTSFMLLAISMEESLTVWKFCRLAQNAEWDFSIHHHIVVTLYFLKQKYSLINKHGL